MTETTTDNTAMTTHRFTLAYECTTDDQLSHHLVINTVQPVEREDALEALEAAIREFIASGEADWWIEAQGSFLWQDALDVLTEELKLRHNIWSVELHDAGLVIDGLRDFYAEHDVAQEEVA